MKNTKTVAIITALCLLFSGCSFFEKPDEGIIDKEELLDLIKEIRLKLPDELKQAKWVKEERQKILVDAQKEASQIIKEAENRIELR